LDSFEVVKLSDINIFLFHSGSLTVLSGQPVYADYWVQNCF